MSSPFATVIPLHKKEGETPLECIERYRNKNPELKKARLGYAGRLDPMAKGLLLVLVDDENLRRKEYERLPKTYRFEILLGIATDTYDILGKITSEKLSSKHNTQTISTALSAFIGKHIQPYPPYSSPRVKGKPLFWWAREDKLDEITIPEKEVEVYSATLDTLLFISKERLELEILGRLTLIKGEFRQEEIIAEWKRFFLRNTRDTFQIATCTVSCSSGTYIRSLAHNIGITLETCALAYSIERTAIGEYTLQHEQESRSPEIS